MSHPIHQTQRIDHITSLPESSSHHSQILATAPLLHGTRSTYSIAITRGFDAARPICAYLVGYERSEYPEGTIFRRTLGNDVEEAVKELYSDVIIDAGKVMEKKGCGATFRGVQMEIDDAEGWTWKVKTEKKRGQQ
jgi:hypothetical protein